MIDIVIPVYNEAANIERNLTALHEGIKASRHAFTVYIVYDFDEDSTLPVIKRTANQYCFPIRLVRNNARGVCHAIKTGINTASGDFVLVTMADMSDDYSVLNAMADKALEGFDIICGSRYMKGGKTHGGPMLKQNLSRLAGLSLHWLTGIPTHDVTNSFKLYRKSMLSSILLESQGGFEIGMEITVKAFINGFKIAEIPCGWWDRTAGESRFQLLKWLPRYLHWYFLLLKHRLGFRN